MTELTISNASPINGMNGYWVEFTFQNFPKRLLIMTGTILFRKILDHIERQNKTKIYDTKNLIGGKLYLEELPTRSSGDVKWIKR